MAMSKAEKRTAAKKNAIAQSQARKAQRDSRMAVQVSGPGKKGKKSLSQKRK